MNSWINTVEIVAAGSTCEPKEIALPKLDAKLESYQTGHYIDMLRYETWGPFWRPLVEKQMQCLLDLEEARRHIDYLLS